MISAITNFVFRPQENAYREKMAVVSVTSVVRRLPRLQGSPHPDSEPHPKEYEILSNFTSFLPLLHLGLSSRLFTKCFCLEQRSVLQGDLSCFAR